jgi:prophage regulatory protein
MSQATQQDNNAERLIFLGEVQRRVPLHRVTLWRLVRSGEFPAPVKVGARRVAWRESEVRAWIESRERAS